MKKLIGGFAMLAFLLGGCSKDNYDDSITQSQRFQNAEIKKVSIDQVPFLMPTVEKFQSRHATSRTIADLDLDLSKILEYSAANGYKSYSIAIIRHDFIDKEDYFFETLHIVKSQEEYKAFVAKYNQEDDSKKFNMATFTGTIEISNIEETLKLMQEFQNGDKKADPAPPTPIDGNTGGGGGSDGPGYSWWYQFLDFLGIPHAEEGNPPYHNYESGSNNDDSDDDDNSNNNNNSSTVDPSDYSSYLIVITPGGISSPSGPGSNTGDGSSSYTNGPTTVANQSWPAPEETSQLIKANLIVQATNMPESQIWLKNPLNQWTPIIYSYLAENHMTENAPTALDVAKMAIKDIENQPNTFQSLTPFILAGNIKTTGLDPCTTSILNQLKGLQQNDIASILARLDNPNSIYTTNIFNGQPSHPFDLATTNWVPSDAGTITHYNYDIKIKSHYASHATRLSIASTLLHELIHAYFLSLIDDCYIADNCAQLETFPELWNFYVQHYNGGVLTNPQVQHNQMAQLYVNTLAKAIQEYDTGVALGNGQQPSQLYTDLAWGGLENTPPYIALPQDDKTRIANRNKAENNNESVTNPSGILVCNPIGVPCN